MKKILSVIGTRPEVIKMAPVIKKIEQTSDLESIVVATSQHREMTKQMCQEFSIFPDIDLDIMNPAQTLSDITEQI
ncbi:MAG: UDP-N-acetylglucosamine 2-epimerase (non-hydrolyzing), partial [Candidatus Zixiibacteriota bacterium]